MELLATHDTYIFLSITQSSWNWGLSLSLQFFKRNLADPYRICGQCDKQNCARVRRYFVLSTFE